MHGGRNIAHDVALLRELDRKSVFPGKCIRHRHGLRGCNNLTYGIWPMQGFLMVSHSLDKKLSLGLL